jgi:transposase
MKERNSGETQELAAAKSGMSVSSGYRIEKGLRQHKKPRTHRTRIDPLADIWESELAGLLQKEPTLSGLTLWEYLDDNFPEQYPYGLLRTLQRRVANYKLEHVPSKDVIFRQSFPAGVQGMSDFTHPDTKITITGVVFKHIIYQFVLTHSHHRYAQVMQGGESFSALSEGLQNAFTHIGGVPQESKTDSLSAAYKNAYEEKTLTDNYNKLCQHYGLKAIRNTKGVSHENGSVETANRALKHRIDQAIKLRGSSDFATIQDYQMLIDAQVKRLNKRSVHRFANEQKALKPLPPHRFMDYQEIATKVTTSSTITIKRTLYSVPSKLI